MFGAFIRERRQELRLGLREFCILAEQDASNWSKVERGQLVPPKEKGILRRIAKALRFEEGTAQFRKLEDLAHTSAGRIPPYIMNDRELVAKLPVFFRTLEGKKPTEAQLRKLAETLRET